MKQVAIYVRVSSEKQADEKTIDSQLAELQEICKDFQNVRIYKDNGWSGETLNRPDIDRLREDVKKDEIESLYIHSLDRLSRNLYQQGILVEDLRKHDVEIFIKDKPIDFTGEGKLLFNLLGAVSEYEKWKILERTQRGRIYKAKNKGIVGGYAPYGYRYVKKTPTTEEHYVIHREETQTVNLIFDLYLQFRSINRVRRELNKKGIKPQRSVTNWCRTSVAAILKNETYIGRGYYGKRYGVETENGKKFRRKIKNGTRYRDKSEWIPITFPVVLDKEKYKLAQEFLTQNSRPFSHTKHFYLLSGLIRCSYCNSTFTAETKTNKYHKGFQYYRCNNRHKANPVVECNASIVRAGEMDEAIWSAVSDAITKPTVLEKHISYLADKTEESEKSETSNKEHLEKEVLEIENKKNRLVDLYTDEKIDREMFDKKVQTYNSRLETLTQSIERANPKQVIDREAVMRNVEIFCDMARERVKNLTPETKKEFLWTLVNGIVYDSKQRKARVTASIAELKGGTNNMDSQVHPDEILEIHPMCMSRYLNKQYLARHLLG